MNSKLKDALIDIGHQVAKARDTKTPIELSKILEQFNLACSQNNLKNIRKHATDLCTALVKITIEKA